MFELTLCEPLPLSWACKWKKQLMENGSNPVEVSNHIYDQEKYIKMSYDAKHGILKTFTKDIMFTKDKAI